MRSRSIQNLQNCFENRSHTSVVENIKFDTSASFVDGNDIEKKFMVVKKSASSISYPNFWDLIWETDSKVIVRFDNGKSIRHPWLNSPTSLEYNVGEYTVWKKTIIDKYYAQIDLTLRNNKEKKSRKITHYQYYEFPEDHTPFYSTQLICFWDIINKKHESCITTEAEGKKKALSPIVLYSAKWIERLVSICVIDICLDQLREEQPVKVPKTLLDVKIQLRLESYGSEEEEFLKKILKHSKSALLWKKEKSSVSEHGITFFKDIVRKYFLVFNRMSAF